MPSGRTKKSPKSGRGLNHVTPKIFGIRSNISPKLHELETSNLVHGFVWRMTSRRTKISPKTGRGLGHVTSTIFGSTVGYPSDSLASCPHYISPTALFIMHRFTLALFRQPHPVHSPPDSPYLATYITFCLSSLLLSPSITPLVFHSRLKQVKHICFTNIFLDILLVPPGLHLTELDSDRTHRSTAFSFSFFFIFHSWSRTVD